NLRKKTKRKSATRTARTQINTNRHRHRPRVVARRTDRRLMPSRCFVHPSRCQGPLGECTAQPVILRHGEVRQVTDWREKEAKYFMKTGRRMPLLTVRGEGTRLWDDAGREYLDFFGGPATVSLGHCHPVLVNALTEQAHELIHVSNQFYSIPQLQLAELLIEHSVFDRVYFMNSGAEANEGALKLARKWGKERKNGAYEFISAIDAFHGRTLQTVTAGGTDRYKAPFAPLPEGFVHVPFNDIDAIKAATSERTVAVFLEPIQGEGGIIVPDDDYLPHVRK